MKTMKRPSMTIVHSFSGPNLEYVSMDNVENFRTTNYIFTDVFSLKGLYLPKAINIPTFDWDSYGERIIAEGLQLPLEYIYAPKATTFNFEKSQMQYFDKMQFIFAPNLTSISRDIKLPAHNLTLYLSNLLTNAYFANGNYTVVAPSKSYAQDWANKYGHTFIPSEDLSFNGFDENSFIYSTSDGKQCSIPIDIVEQMWYDYLPINENPDYMTHGYIFDVVNDDFINAKDFAKIHHLSKYGW